LTEQSKLEVKSDTLEDEEVNFEDDQIKTGMENFKTQEEQIDFKSIYSNIDNLKSYLETDINNVKDLRVFLDIIKDQK